MSESPNSPTPEIEEDLRTKLVRETSKIGWNELQKFYAKGMVVKVGKGMNLIEVAEGFSEDNKALVEGWLKDGSVMRATDEQALAWHEADATVWAVVVAPWILVQDVADKV